MDFRYKKNNKDKKKPRVPLKTYKWEDIRRARRRGGYPWTYLYKQPFGEEADPESFTMEALRKSKSSSTLGKSNDIEISEITESEKDSLSASLEIPEKTDTLQIITEPDNHSKKSSTGSMVIEECDMYEEGNQKSEMFTLESAESSDNISQYLEKEERGPKNVSQNDSIDIPKISDTSTRKVDEKSFAKLEDHKKKRKLSAESSYSKLSLTKLAMIKKFKDTKNKIKVPKLSFPTTKLKKPTPKKKSSPPELRKDVKKQPMQSKDVKPVYIHIPLKPPPGQTDEFSYLESHEKSEKIHTSKKIGTLKDIIRNLKQQQEVNAAKEKEETQATIKEDTNNLETNAFADTAKNIVDSKEPVANKILDPISSNWSEVKSGNQSESNINEDVIREISNNPENISKPDPYLKSENIDEIQESLENKTVEDVNAVEEAATFIKENDEDIFEQLFKAQERKTEIIQPDRVVRSKSAEPERKRKLSLESSYSRKSLSKLGLLKKLKEASNKIKSTLSRSNSNKQLKVKDDGTKKEIKKPKQPIIEDSMEPKYIHIPLKPPEGQTDEFSHLEFEEKCPIDNVESNGASTSPESPIHTDVVQFIILTAPSDDEILDYHSSDAPETPSSESKVFFGSKADELRQLAKAIVNEISTSTVPKKLESVSEEGNSDKTKNEDLNQMDHNQEIDIISPTQVVQETNQKITIDVEDGLSESKFIKENKSVEKSSETTEQTQIIIEQATEGKEQIQLNADLSTEIKVNTQSCEDQLTEVQQAQTVEDQPLELKSSLKGEGSPIMKKKVSFKRRSKTTKDGSYEDIQISKPPTDDNRVEVDSRKPRITASTINQSMSVEEEKTYLDDKIIKSTSLEEDYNKWSKISDHEYEPVNPPPDNHGTFPPIAPIVQITDTDRETNYTLSVDISRDVSPVNEIPFNDVENPQSTVVNHTTDNSNPITAPSVLNNDNNLVQETNSPAIQKNKKGTSRLQTSIKQKTDQFKNKLHNMKKPNIHLPNRPMFQKPNFQKFKIDKTKFKLPKIPDTTKINLPTFSLPRRHNTKRSLKERRQSTESNADDSKKPIFDFSTYPRIFKKKRKSTDEHNENIPEFATVPRPRKDQLSKSTLENREDEESVRVPLHSEDSMNIDYVKESCEIHEPQINYDDNREDSIERRMISHIDYNDGREDSIERRMASHIRYDDDIDIDDEYERETHDINKNDYLSRWNHGSFKTEPTQEYINNYRNSEYKVTDLDSPEDLQTNKGYDFNSYNRDNYSSGSSLGVHRRGVLEEINPDEFFLRQKGISQDNIDVGMYLSSEIREAFRTPDNALSQIQDSYNLRSSNQSLPSTQSKRKQIKKPKRKKTPHVSQEKIPYAEESTEEDLDMLPPSRPKRRSKRVKKTKNFDDVIPYQDTISVDINNPEENIFYHRESLEVLGDDERDMEESNIMYENETTQEKEQPETQVTDSYKKLFTTNKHGYNSYEKTNDIPSAPPRKQKSLKSLNLSENNSMLDDFELNKDISETAIDKFGTDSEFFISNSHETPKKPTRTRSRTNSQTKETAQQDDGNLSRNIESTVSGNQIPCTEEPCVKDVRDYMGYAIIDKQKIREPPLPPPRTTPRRKKPIKSTEDNFFTCPRQSHMENSPVRPLRNYSTLGQTKKNNQYENKENIDIMQYTEINDEPNRDLHSGEVIKKMKDRPLPAPPRPPRKSRPLRDITSKENIMLNSKNSLDKLELEELDMSTQTEPLPDDFVCEEMIQEPSDTILLPSESKVSADEKPFVEKRLITPTFFTHEETITHGSLLIEPIHSSNITQHEIAHHSQERIIPISVEIERDEISSIPEEFNKLEDPPQESKNGTEVIQFVDRSSHNEIEILKAQRLQVSDLDVDTLTVNKLLAGKIVVSEIDSNNIHTDEIGSKSGALKIGEIELSSGKLIEIIKSLKMADDLPANTKTDQNHPDQEKKTSITDNSDSPIMQPLQSYIDTPSQIQSKEVYPEDTIEYNQTLEETPETSHTRLEKISQISQAYLEDTLQPMKEPSQISSHHTLQTRSDDTLQQFPQIQLKHVIESPQTNLLRSSQSTQSYNMEENENISRYIHHRTNSQETWEGVDNTTMSHPEYLQYDTLGKTSDTSPQRPPRQSEKIKQISNFGSEELILEPEVDDEPPPRPPQPQLDYIPSQPPASFYALRAQKYVDNFDENIPVVPRRRRQQNSKAISRSSSEESPATSPHISRRFYSRSPEPSIPQLSGQLYRACSVTVNNALKRLITHITQNVLGNSDGKQDLHVITIILLVLIAGLILLGYGDEKTVVHLHHWEYFNPPKDM